MTLQLSFDEINSFIKHEVNAIDITLSQVENQIVCATIKKGFISKDMDIAINQIEDNSVNISILAGKLVTLGMNIFGGKIKRMLPTWIEQTSNTTFIIHLNQIDKAQHLLQYLSLQEVNVLADGLQAVVAIK